MWVLNNSNTINGILTYKNKNKNKLLKGMNLS